MRDRISECISFSHLQGSVGQARPLVPTAPPTSSFRFSACLFKWGHYATSMKSLHIRDVPEQTIEQLKRRARRHHRSLQGELQALLEEAAKQAGCGDSSEFSLHTVRTQGNQDWSREGLYED
jgi:plasmid stability protein